MTIHLYLLNNANNTIHQTAFPGGTVVKNLPANAGDVRDTGSIPGSGRSPGGGNKATHSSILAWKIPRTEEPGRPQFLGSQRVKHDWVINTFRWGSQYYLQFLRREDELEHDHRRVSKAVRERTDGIEI